MATGLWTAEFVKTSAKAKLTADGRLEVTSATSDIGTGTVLVLVAADTLGLPPDRISVRIGDSDLPHSPVQGGSRAAASGGAAVQLACGAIGKRLLQAA